MGYRNLAGVLKKLVGIGAVGVAAIAFVFFLAGPQEFSSSPAAAQEVYSTSGAVYGAVYAPGTFPAEPWVGGFVVEADYLKGSDLWVGKVYAETSESSSEPQAKIGLNRVTISGLHLYKNLTAPDGTPFNLTIKTLNPGDVVTVEGGFFEKDLKVCTSELYGKKLVARALRLIPITLTDYWSTEPENDLLLRLGGLTDPSLEGWTVKLNTHSLKASRITIPNLVLTVEPGHKTSYVE